MCSKKFRKIHKKTTKACNFINKEALVQVFSCEFCEISKNTFLQNTSGGYFCIGHGRYSCVFVVEFGVAFANVCRHNSRKSTKIYSQ